MIASRTKLVINVLEADGYKILVININKKNRMKDIKANFIGDHNNQDNNESDLFLAILCPFYITLFILPQLYLTTKLLYVSVLLIP